VIGVGFADLSFQLQNNHWSIYGWHDRVDPAFGVNPSSTDAPLDELVPSAILGTPA